MQGTIEKHSPDRDPSLALKELRLPKVTPPAPGHRAARHRTDADDQQVVTVTCPRLAEKYSAGRVVTLVAGFEEPLLSAGDAESVFLEVIPQVTHWRRRVSDLAQSPGESPRSWLTRLHSMDVEVLSSAQRRSRIGYLAEARRLLQEEQQKAKWDRDKK